MSLGPMSGVEEAGRTAVEERREREGTDVRDEEGRARPGSEGYG